MTRFSFRFTLFPILSIWIACANPAASQTVIYVDRNATGLNDGTSWQNAYAEVRDALGDTGGNEIWVAAGNYKPALPNGDRNATFQLRDGAALYGGFTGSEATRDGRDPKVNVTLLSGDLNGDDGGGSGANGAWANMGENSYHVITATDLTTPTGLDGFIIERGWSWQSSGNNSAGAGVFITGSSSLTIANCTVRGNLAHSGAGIYDAMSSTTIDGCVVSGNLASDGRGGGIYHAGNWQDYETVYPMTITGTTFSGNRAEVGAGQGDAGALWSDFRAPVHISGCLFENNQAKWRFNYGNSAAGGGAILLFGDGSSIVNSIFRGNSAHIGGAIWLAAKCDLVNCLFEGNSAFRQSNPDGFVDYGGYCGAIYLVAQSSDPTKLETVNVVNCTFQGNHAQSYGGIGVFNYGAAWTSDVHIVNSVLWGNTATEEGAPLADAQLVGDVNLNTLSHTCVQGYWAPIPGEDPKDRNAHPTVFDFDPLYINASAGDYRLGAGSPYIDAGMNSAYTASFPSADLGGNTRIHDDAATPDTGSGTTPLIDFGAFEFGPWVDYGNNALPVAQFVFEIDGAAVQFEDSSSDPDGTVTEWFWDFGDGAQSTEQNPSHTYSANGSFGVSLSVRDNDHGTARSAVQTVTITGHVPPALTIVAPAPGSTVGNTVTIEIEATDPSQIDEVKYYLDDVFVVKGKDAPFSASWDTTTTSDGIHTLQARITTFVEDHIWSDPIQVDVNNVLPRIVSGPPSGAINVGSAFQFQVVATGQAPLQFALESHPQGMAIDAATGLITWTPTAAQFGIQNGRVAVSNASGAAQQDFFLQVLDIEAPTAPVNAGITNVTETSAQLNWEPSSDNVAVDHYVLWYFLKVNRFPGHWRRTTTTTTATSLTVNPSPTASYTPKYSIAAVDAAGNESGRTATFAVTLNTAPFLYHNPVGEVFNLTADVPGTFLVSAGGRPAPTFSVVTGPLGMVIDSTAGVVSWTPPASAIGTGTATVRGDNAAGFDEFTLTYNVLPGPDTEPPSSTPTPLIANITSVGCDLSWTAATDNEGVTGYLIKALEDGAGNALFTAADVPGNATSFTISNLNPNSGYQLWIAAYDAAGNGASIDGVVPAQFNTLPPPFTNPVATTIGNVAIVAGGPAVTAEVSTVTDQADADASLAVAVAGAPAGLTVTVTNNGGTVAATTLADCALAEGIYSIMLTVTDSDLQTGTTTFDVAVTPNPAPVLGAYLPASVPAVQSIAVSPAAPPSDANNNISSVTVTPTVLSGAGTLQVDATTGVVTIATFVDTVPGDYAVSVSVVDACGATATQSFTLTIQECEPPLAATTPTPPDLATDVEFTPTLQWVSPNTPPAHCPIDFDVYLGTANPPVTLAATGLTATTFTPAALAEVTTYYWQVVTKDCCGETPGAVWSFTTKGLPRISVTNDIMDYVLNPNETTSAQMTITNNGTGVAAWNLADYSGLPPAAPAAPAAGDPPPAGGEPAGQPNIAWGAPHEPETLLVRFKGVAAKRNPAAIKRRAATHKACGTEKLGSCKYIPMDFVRVPKHRTLKEVAAEYQTLADVDYVEPNYLLSINAAPDDPSYSSLWGLDNTGQTGGIAGADIDAPQAWDLTTGSANVVVAVIDTGIDYNHPELAGNMWTNDAELNGTAGVDDDANGIVDDIHGARWTNANGLPTNGNPYDDHRHGTHVAGTIGAAGNNGAGVVGVSWNVRLMALKFLNSAGSGYTSDAISALEYAMDKGAHISNNSWGGGAFSQALQDTIDAAGTAGHLFVVAAGNSARNIDTSAYYPAAYPSQTLLSVASTDHADARSSFSNWGATSVDLAAPGSNILSTTPGNTYSTFSGTSMATPHVSGVAALVLSRFPNLSPLDLKTRIMDAADPIAGMEGLTVTGGRLNAANALSGLSWFDATPFGGTLDPGASVIVNVTIDATGLAEGVFESGTLRIMANEDPDGPVDIPISLQTINAPPMVAIAAPLNNSTISGMVAIDADATDNVAVTLVQFYVDTLLIGQAVDAPYSVSWDTTALPNGVHFINAIAYDQSANMTTSTTVGVVVENLNTPPAFLVDPMSRAGASSDVPYSGTLSGSANDPDIGDLLSYSKVSGPAWLSVAASGALSGTPAATDAGTNSWVVAVSDGGSSDEAVLNINVIAPLPNASPAFAADPIIMPDATVDLAYTGALAGAASDPDGDLLTFSKLSGPGWLTVAADGSMSGTPLAADAGANSWVVSVDDGNGGSDQAVMNMAVNELVGPPVEATFVSVASEDGWVRESSENSNSGGSLNSTDPNSKALRAGDDDSRRQYKIILSFDTSSVPDNAVIDSAILYLTRGGTAGSNPMNTHGALSLDVHNGSFSGAAALESSDFETPASAPNAATITNQGGKKSLYAIDLTTATNHVNKTGRTQMRASFALDDDDDGVKDLTGFYSADYSSASRRPMLVVTYRESGVAALGLNVSDPDPTAPSLEDTDQDGMPDSWEEDFALDPNDPGDADLDSDGDRRSNLSEYVAVTNPLDRDDYFDQTMFLAGGSTFIRFVAQPGRNYVVEYSNGLEAWRPLATLNSQPTVRPFTIEDAELVDRRFYRIRAEVAAAEE